MKYIIFIIGLVCLTNTTKAQKLDSLTRDTLMDAEIRLNGLAQKMVTSLDEMTRISSGKNFIRTLARTLKTNNSYFYNSNNSKNNK